MTDSEPPSEPPPPWLSTAAGEAAFFKAVMRARPVGVHRFFHVLSIRSRIISDAGPPLSVDEIWAKLQELWDLNALEAFEGIGWPTDDDPGSPTQTPVHHPEPDDNLRTHKFFQAEFALPHDDFHSLMTERAAAAHGQDSPPASPSAFSVADTIASENTRTPGRGGRGRIKTRGSRGSARSRGRGTGSSKGRGRPSNAKMDDDGESSELTEAEEASQDESGHGSARPSGTPMDEDDDSGQSDDEDVPDDDDGPRARGARGRKRAARGRPSTTQPPPKKRRKSNAK